MLSRCLAALVLVLAPLRSSAEPSVEENVVVLTPDTFDDWIGKHDYAIVGARVYTTRLQCAPPHHHRTASVRWHSPRR